MLLELNVSDFAIIDNIRIEFRSGLNILSGETGAGKSILLKSLSLLMGGKSSSEDVRSGAQAATVEGFFDLSERPDVLAILKQLDISDNDETLIVRRVISKQGKSRVYLNGTLSTLHDLKTLVSPLVEVAGRNTPLIEMTGQHDSKHLLDRSYHLDIVDQFAGTMDLRKAYTKEFHQAEELRQQIEELKEKQKLAAQRLDFLEFQREEIKALGLEPGDDTELEQKVARLKNSKRLSEFAAETEYHLYSGDDSILSRVHHILQSSAQLKSLDSAIGTALEPLSQAKALIEEAAFELRDYSRQLDSSPEQLSELETKLDQYRKAQKKFGADLEEIFQTLESIEAEINEYESADETTVKLEKQLKEIQVRLKDTAEELHENRVKASKQLTVKVTHELEDLNMKGLEFSIRVDRSKEAGPTGVSFLEFLVRPSKKDEYRPLNKIASGGELSRLLLSLKRISQVTDLPRTYLFDEVDTGVSGVTAEKVGKKLRQTSEGQQVVCITHLPQVAAFGNQHYLISKNQVKGRVQMTVTSLDDNSRVREMARLISGERITETSLNHAKALLQNA